MNLGFGVNYIKLDEYLEFRWRIFLDEILFLDENSFIDDKLFLDYKFLIDKF